MDANVMMDYIKYKDHLTLTRVDVNTFTYTLSSYNPISGELEESQPIEIDIKTIKDWMVVAQNRITEAEEQLLNLNNLIADIEQL